MSLTLLEKKTDSLSLCDKELLFSSLTLTKVLYKTLYPKVVLTHNEYNNKHDKVKNAHYMALQLAQFALLGGCFYTAR